MRPLTISSLLLCASTAVQCLRPRYANARGIANPAWRQGERVVDYSRVAHAKRDAAKSHFATAATQSYAVEAKAIPEVKFDPGESYSGTLPVGGDSNGKLFFWFWPTTAPDEPKEILIWLNGGPGCSSLEGFLQELGPISWQMGTHAPVSNPWSWHRLTNIVFIEQPVGTGYSTGNATAKNEDDVAHQFMGFWKNFMDLFQMKGYKVYITGESYAGMYCPYIASNMLDANDTDYFNVAGMMINDPSITDTPKDVSIKPFVDYWAPAFPFNDTIKDFIINASKTCGYDDFRDKYLTFPANSAQPVALPGKDDKKRYLPGCNIAYRVTKAMMELNPAFNIYQVAALPPLPDDVLGFPTQLTYIPEGEQVYFNRSDVKAAIHAPADVDWSICTERDVFANANNRSRGDASPGTAYGTISKVIDRTKNVMISHAANDFILLAAQTLLAIQNMTWGGSLGFANMPTGPLFVPHHPLISEKGVDYATASGQGILGTAHSERGLTWVVVNLAGHMIPSSQPAVAFRQVEYLLGRVHSLGSTQPLSIYPNATQPSEDSLGKGTAPVFGRLLSDNSKTGSGCSPSPTNSKPSSASKYRSGQLLLFSISAVFATFLNA